MKKVERSIHSYCIAERRQVTLIVMFSHETREKKNCGTKDNMILAKKRDFCDEGLEFLTIILLIGAGIQEQPDCPC